MDARNPLFFRVVDLAIYIKEVDPAKQILLLVNKADLMTLEQREEWAAYYKSISLDFIFFSATTEQEFVDSGAQRAT